MTLLQQLLIYCAPTIYQARAKLYHVILILIGALLKNFMIKVKFIKTLSIVVIVFYCDSNNAIIILTFMERWENVFGERRKLKGWLLSVLSLKRAVLLLYSDSLTEQPVVMASAPCLDMQSHCVLADTLGAITETGRDSFITSGLPVTCISF